MNPISNLFARAKATVAAVVVSAPKVVPRRVRPIDRSCSAGEVISVDEEGWIFWIGDDGYSHISKPDYLEPA